MRTRHIGIIGAGIAGLHLGLRLQRLGIACTIITDKTPEQIAAAQLANMVVHWPTTLGRERVLGVYHWPAEEYGFQPAAQQDTDTRADRYPLPRDATGARR